MKKRTLAQLTLDSKQFKKCCSLQDISKLLGVRKNNMILFAFEPLYYHFTTLKKGGGFRHIEAPELELKSFQRKLSSYLQAVYYFMQSTSSYGYIPVPKYRISTKGIYNNALKHLGCTYLINADFKDFFHQIKIENVTTIFKNKPFGFNRYTAHTLAKICCYKGRLPMGAPTSPVLSNLFALQIDNALEKWAKNNHITYTRFVDDLSFSSKKIILDKSHYNNIESIVNTHGLSFNPKKTRYLNVQDKKTITGLVLNETVDIDIAYYNELEKDIKRLAHAMELKLIMGNTHVNKDLKAYQQQVMGKINFIAMIEGKKSKQHLHYLNAFHKAQEPDDTLVNRWTQFSNYT